MALGISEQQETRMIAARAARNKQDAKHPFLINVKDGRLVPNVPALRGRPAEKVDGREIPAKPGHPDYRVYTGSVKASLEERMKWLETSGAGVGGTRRAVVLSDEEPFDLNTATLDEMIEFAKSEYDKVLDKSMGMKAVRKAVADLAIAAGAVREESLG